MRACKHCGRSLEGATQKKYCSVQCRKTAWRALDPEKARVGVRKALKKRYDRDPEYRAGNRAAVRAWRGRRKTIIGQGRGTNTAYRSKMEERLAPGILAAGGVYESHRLVYVGKPRGYTPDFVLPNGITLEVKGWFPSADRTKMAAVAAQFPGLDLRMILATPHAFITKARTQTQAEWCTRHGLRWADNEVPAAWLAEPPNASSLRALATAKRVIHK